MAAKNPKKEAPKPMPASLLAARLRSLKSEFINWTASSSNPLLFHIFVIKQEGVYETKSKQTFGCAYLYAQQLHMIRKGHVEINALPIMNTER